jgi:precorrin-3B C17-methyltransferase
MTRLYVVGTGPGASDLVAPKALEAIKSSSDLVAYGLYLDLLGDVCKNKHHHDLPLCEDIGSAR